MLFLGVAAAMLSACASTPPLATNGEVTVVDMRELPAPTDQAANDPGNAGYQIGAYDRIVVDVFGFPELNARRIQVDGSGRIALPLAGSMDILGRTPNQVSDMIVQRLRAAHVRNPVVAVNIEESVSKYVTVDGQVGQPGNYPLLGEMTLMRAVAAARGAGEFARLNDVVVFRTVNGQRMAALYNLAAIRRGYYADPRIYAQDVVVVGESSARRIFRDIISTSPLFVSPIVALLNNNN